MPSSGMKQIPLHHIFLSGNGKAIFVSVAQTPELFCDTEIPVLGLVKCFSG